jgi:hypothetical protein
LSAENEFVGHDTMSLSAHEIQTSRAYGILGRLIPRNYG